MSKRAVNKAFTEIGERLIREEPELRYIAESDARIAFLEEDSEKKKGNRLIFGQCEKVPEKYKWTVPYDFMITIFLPNVERFDQQQLEILLFHELLHVGIEADGNDETYNVREHDVEEFRQIIDRFGIDWSCE